MLLSHADFTQHFAAPAHTVFVLEAIEILVVSEMQRRVESESESHAEPNRMETGRNCTSLNLVRRT